MVCPLDPFALRKARLQALRSVPATVDASLEREALLREQSALLEEAARLCSLDEEHLDVLRDLQQALADVLDQYLDALEEEVGLGTFTEIKNSLNAIQKESARLLDALRQAPVEALRLLDQQTNLPSGFTVVEKDAPNGIDQSLSIQREIWSSKTARGELTSSGLIRRLIALNEASGKAKDTLSEEASDPGNRGAKSIREAREGRTPDMELFESLVRVIGHTSRGVANLRRIAVLMYKAAHGLNPPGEEWGLHHEKEAKRWWNRVKAHTHTPLGRVPKDIQDLLQGGVMALDRQRVTKKDIQTDP